jgi:hypothetical protein
MNILLLLFLFQNDPSILSSYLKQHCSSRGGDGSIFVSEKIVLISCKDEGSSELHVNLREILK